MKRMLAVLWLIPFVLVGLTPAQDKPKKEETHGRGYKPMSPEKAKAMHAAAFRRHGYLMKVLAKNVTPPAKFDCNDLGIVPPVVDQGQCGDCYGVSDCDCQTAAWIKAGWGKADGSFKISDQFGLDCGAFDGGCNGGDEAQVAEYAKTKGFPAEKWIDPSTGTKMSDYGSYTANPGRCQLKSGAKLWQLKDWGYVAGDQGQGPASLDEYKAALMTYGMLNIALDAGAFDGYTGGVITRLGNSIDHAISCTGWDDGKQVKIKMPDGNEVTSTGAIHVRNNWGTSWGEQGYAWIAYSEVPKIVEPMWLLAPSLTPPVPPPVPPTPPVPPGPNPPIPPVPVPPGSVDIILTPEQVASVNAQSGALVITGATTMQQIADQVNAQSGQIVINKGMTLEDFMRALEGAKGKTPPCGPQKPQPADDSVKKELEAIKASNAELKRALDALLKAALKE